MAENIVKYINLLKMLPNKSTFGKEYDFFH
jgi:hypothetical protein